MIRDVRLAWRSIARGPFVAAVVVVSLAAGIGVNTVVFSWVETWVLRPLPAVPGAAGFHFVEARARDTGLYTASSWLEYRDLAAELDAFEALIAFRMTPTYVGEPGRIERVYGQLVSANFFEGLGLEPAAGRFFRAGEAATPGGAPVAVISYGFWQSRFGGAAAAVGRPLRVNGAPLTIIGVTPRSFQGPVLGLAFEVWMPATLAPVLQPGSRELEERTVRAYSLMGRLAPGTTRAQAQQEADAAMARLATAHPRTNGAIGAEVLPFWQTPRGPQRMMAQSLVALQAIMLLLLAAVCGNLANLMLARASRREREMSVRVALGAGRARIVRLVLIESVMLSLAGAVAGAALAVWGTRALWTLPLTGLPIRLETQVTGLGVATALMLGAGAGLLFGAAPAARLAGADPQAAFRAGTRLAGPGRLGRLLMGVQVALAVIVLIVAAVFLRQFVETRDTDTGFAREGVLLAAYDLEGLNPDEDRMREIAARLIDRLRALPGVEGAAIATSVPLDIHGLPSRVFTVEGHARTGDGFDRALANTVTQGYFAAMRIPIIAGTDFAAPDDTAAPPQAIVNQAFVARYLPGLEPLGRRLQARGMTFAIAGVARDSLYDAFGEPPTPIIYLSFRDTPVAVGELHVRTEPGRERTLAAAVRQAVREVSADVPVFNVRTITEHIDTNLVFVRVPARMFAVLAPLLLALAAVGIYAVVAHATAVRTTEIGVRLALGATPRRVVGRFVADSLGVVSLGAAVGWAIALLVASDLAPGEVDLPAFAGVPLLLLLVAAGASWLPAFRATRRDPVTALRAD